jgi:hypothetical protein
VLTFPNSQQRVKSVDRCDLHRTGDKTDTIYNVKQGFGSVDPYVGTITHSIYWKTAASTWTLSDSTSVAATDAHYYIMSDNSSHLDIRFTITNASNDSHHRAVVKDMYRCQSGCSWNGQVCLCGT